jgi:glucokinase
MQREAIGIDIGGTNIRAARVSGDGRILDRRAVPSARDPEACTRLCIDLIAALKSDSTASVGIGVPGQVDFQSQTVLSGGYVDLSSLDFAARIAQKTGLPATIDNDANMALVGEAACGAARSLSNAVLLTIGTGIGGAILDQGIILRGRGTAGQLGHMTVIPDGRPCVCGRIGCVETESSGTAFGVHLREAGLPSDTRAEDLLAAPGDATAVRVLNRWAAPLHAAIDTLIATLAPEAVLIGGGAGAAALSALRRIPTRRSWFSAQVLAAALGDDAGVVGAAVASLPRGRRAVLVNGVPASGKSLVAQMISDRTGWPILSLDTVKTPFLAELAPVDRMLNRTLGKAAYQSIFGLIADFPPGATVIIDAWFGFQPVDALNTGLAIAGITDAVEVWCHAPPEVIGARYSARIESRPAGHPGLDYVPELMALAERARPIGTFPCIDVQTNDRPDAAELVKKIGAAPGWTGPGQHAPARSER